MNLKEVILKRTSVRAFKDTEVPDELIMEVLENGNLAPTAGNVQPWEFILVKNQRNKERIVETTYIGAEIKSGNTQDWMLNAPIFIIVCGNKKSVIKKYGEDGAENLLYQDCSVCIENMLLTIVDIGLASCCVSGFKPKELSQVLELPAHILPIAILPIGYSGTIKEKRPEKIDVQSKIHYETY